MRKFLDVLRSSTGAMFLSIICASIGSAMFIPGTGVVTTLPFVVVFTAIPTLICKKYYIPVFFLAVSYFFCFAKDTPLKYPNVLGGYTLYIALWAFDISAITCLACFFIEKAVKNKAKRITFSSVAAVLFALGIFCTTMINGTPWGLIKARDEILAYRDTRFASEDLDVGDVYYNAKGKYYACDAQIKGSTNKGSFICSDGVTNTLDIHAVNIAGYDKANEIAMLLRKSFPNDRFTVTPNERSFDGIKVSFKDTSNLLPLISYTITIHSEETAKSFVKKAETYVSVLSNSNINCGKLTIVGGAKQRLYYTISVDATAPHANLVRFLRIYNNTLLPQNSVISAHKTFLK